MFQILRKAFALLTDRERWLWGIFLPISVGIGLLEAFGAAIVFGLIGAISDPSKASQVPLISSVITGLPGDDKDTVLILTATAAIFFIAKNLLLSVGIYFQNRVVSNSVSSMSRRLFKAYLTAPYSFHFQRNSADLIYNSTGAVKIVLSAISAAVTIVSEVLLVSAIMAVLLITAPVVTLITGTILVGLTVLLLKLTQVHFARWGARIQVLNKEVLQTVQQGLGGLKEIKLLGRENLSYDAFSTRQQEIYQIAYRRETLSALPRYLLEALFVSGALLIVFLVTLQGETNTDVLPLIGLYAYAGFRIIPSIGRVIWKLNSIRYGQTPVDRIYHDYMMFSKDSERDFLRAGTELPFVKEIALESLSYTYPAIETASVVDINLMIKRGQSIGIVGSTGAGKSTLVDLFMGLLTPSEGRITVDHRDVAYDLPAWQRKIGYVAQSIFLADDSLKRNVALGLPDDEIDDNRLKEAIRTAQIDEFVDSLPEGVGTFVGERGVRLSGGERQRVGIARALYHQPEVLVFDEATSSLDNQTEASVIQAIQRLQGDRTLLIIAHRLSTIRWCDHLIHMKDGRIVESGTFDELYSRSTEFRALADAAELDTPVVGS